MNRDTTPKPHEARRRRHDPADSEAHAHRRATDADAVLRLHDRLDDAERRIDGHDEAVGSLVDNMKSLNQNIGRVADVLEALSNLKGFMLTIKLMSGAAKLLLPLLAVGALVVTSIVLYVKTGQWKVGP